MSSAQTGAPGMGAGAGDLSNVVDPTGASAAAAAGFPDPEALSRLAGEFFGALGRTGSFGTQGTEMAAAEAIAQGAGVSTGGAIPTGLSPTMGILPSIGAAPVVMPMAVPATAVPATVVPATAIPAPVAPAAGTAPAALAVPGVAGLDFGAAPGLGFLGDVRSLDALVRSAGDAAALTGATGVGGAPATGVGGSEYLSRSAAGMAPSAPGVQAIPGAASGAAGTVAGVPAMPGVSAVPAAAVPGAQSISGVPAWPGLIGGDFGAVPGLGFLGDIRSLDTAVRSAGDAASLTGATSAAGNPAIGVGGSEFLSRSAAAMTPAAPGVQAIPGAGSMGTMAGLPAMPGVPTIPSGGSLGDPAALSRAAGDAGDLSAVTRPGSAGALPFGISLEEIASPQLPSARAPLPGVDQRGTSSFIEALRPLDPFGVTPSLAPADSTLGGLRAADISSIPFDVQAVRRDFPILEERVNGKQLVWLDNAATTQKPRQVIDRLTYFYEHENSNVHRAAHTLAARSTDAFEGAREKVRRFINAPSAKEIIFVRGATEGINLVAQTWGKKNIQAGDEVVLTHLEHHANIVPWQMICAEKGAKLRVAPVDDSGQIILGEYERLMNAKTRLVAFPHVSNALGTVTPAREMIEIAHRHGAKVLLDGAQSIQHMTVDVQALDCDFFVFSGHKLFAPTGIGAVFGKYDILEGMPPYQGGGNMIADVTFERTVYHAPPLRFEAGTGNIADAVGLGAAIDYLQRLGMPLIERYEHDLHVYGTEVLSRIPGLKFIGTAKNKTSVLSFVLDGFRTEDVGQALAAQGIAVRAGHHCAQPILRRMGVESTVRPSIAFYNTCEEMDELGAALRNIRAGRTVGPV